MKFIHKLTHIFIWHFARIFPFLRLKAKSAQGIFLIPSEAIKANDFIHKSLYIDKCFEYDIYLRAINFLKNKCLLNKTNNNILLDVGINNGVITIGAIKSDDFNFAIGIDGCSDHIDSCEKNLELNNIKNVKLFNSVLSDKKKSVNFVKSKTNLGQHCISNVVDDFKYLYDEEKNSTTILESATLDEIITPYLDRIQNNNCLLWIDVEGHEAHVFKGAPQLLDKNIPCVMEMCPYMIKRSGMCLEEYIAIIQKYWNEFWIIRDYKIVNYPTSVLSNFINEFEDDGSYQNIILTS